MRKTGSSWFRVAVAILCVARTREQETLRERVQRGAGRESQARSTIEGHVRVTPTLTADRRSGQVFRTAPAGRARLAAVLLRPDPGPGQE